MVTDEVTCPDCGDRHLHAREDEAAGAALHDEVEIARINADRDIRLARISAGLLKDEAVTGLAASSAHAEGEADGLREALAPPPGPEPGQPEPGQPEPEPGPVTVIADDAGDAGGDGLEPPPPGAAPAPAPRRRSLGAW